MSEENKVEAPEHGAPEPVPEPAPVPAANPQDELANAIKNIESKIGTPKQEDPYSLDGTTDTDIGTDPISLGSTPTEPVDTSDSNVLAERIEQLEADNRRLKTRSSLNELEEWIKENRPDAFMPSVKRAIRNGSSVEVIKGIASASHNDVERGKKMLMDELGADLKTIKNSVGIKFEAQAKEQFGGPPVGEQAAGGMDIKQFLEKIKTMDGPAAEKLMGSVKLGERNPYKGQR